MFNYIFKLFIVLIAMKELIFYKNKVNAFLYQKMLKHFLFLFDPERMHHSFIKLGKFLGGNIITKRIVKDLFHYKNSMLKQKILGIEFKNPVGLSAGFDKNAEIISICEDVGFGFSEVGSVTKMQCAGNKGKRLERLIDKKSLWVYMGLNNNGADEIFARLSKQKYKIPFGVSIAKTNCKETADDSVGREDYIYSLKKFNSMNIGKFYVLNISCPNAYGGQPFSDVKRYESLLKDVYRLKVKKPIFVKLSPDLTRKNIDGIIRISEKYGISGFVISNLSKKHGFNNGKGGLSGKEVEKKANSMLRYVALKGKGKFVLIGVGGIFSAEDAYRKIKLGASLVEIITGMIYQGPGLIGEINYELSELLKKDGYKNIKEAVGKALKPVA